MVVVYETQPRQQGNEDYRKAKQSYKSFHFRKVFSAL